MQGLNGTVIVFYILVIVFVGLLLNDAGANGNKNGLVQILQFLQLQINNTTAALQGR